MAAPGGCAPPSRAEQAEQHQQAYILVTSILSTPQVKSARAAQMSREGFACPNPQCMCTDCTCGEGCTCNQPDAAEPVTCDPCKDFKAAKMAAAAAAKATIKVGGVPEHFNLPWKLATEQDLWTKHSAPAVEFLEVKGGTGAMIKGLRDKEYESGDV